MSVRVVSCARAAVLVSLAALASCGSLRKQEDNPGPCPRAFGLYDAARIVEFSSDQVLPENVTYTAEIQGVESLCRYTNDPGPIRADLRVEVGYGRGEAATSDRHTYQMFVAVTRTDSTVIAKEVFPVEVKFGRGDAVEYRVEEFNNIEIPRASGATSGTNFEILVGFELTPEQIEFNRLGTRFTFQSLD